MSVWVVCPLGRSSVHLQQPAILNPMRAIESKQRINIPKDELWAHITSPKHLELCHPYMLKHFGTTTGSLISDTIQYQNGVQFTRQSVLWLNGEGYDLLVGRKQGKKNRVSWRIKSADATSCDLTISVVPESFKRSPSWLQWMALKLYINPKVRLYLNAVTSGIKQWAESGEPIDKSAFRTHSWFSTE